MSLFDQNDIKEDKKEQYLPIVKAEGDYEAFESHGLACRIIRMPSGHLNGYVAVKKESPLYGKNYYESWYSDEDKEKMKPEYVQIMELINGIGVHGGLTYASDNLMMQPEKDVWWFGFDTNHLCDLNLTYDSSWNADATYKTKEYVKAECESLAKQLYEAEQALSSK